MLPHDREEYRAQMGHVWLGFAESDLVELASSAGFADVRMLPLPTDPKAKGPALFAARAIRPASSSRQHSQTGRRSR